MRKTALQIGFTLIELLVVISIIGILTTLVAANLNSARSRARDAERKSDLRNIATSLRLYFNDYGVYPSNDSSGEILGCGAAGTSTCAWGSSWTAGSGPTTYMSTLPKDPFSNQSYVYSLGPLGDTFILSACLENASDTQGVPASPNPFSFSCTTMFQVKQQ